MEAFKRVTEMLRCLSKSTWDLWIFPFDTVGSDMYEPRLLIYSPRTSKQTPLRTAPDPKKRTAPTEMGQELSMLTPAALCRLLRLPSSSLPLWLLGSLGSSTSRILGYASTLRTACNNLHRAPRSSHITIHTRPHSGFELHADPDFGTGSR